MLDDGIQSRLRTTRALKPFRDQHSNGAVPFVLGIAQQSDLSAVRAARLAARLPSAGESRRDRHDSPVEELAHVVTIRDAGGSGQLSDPRNRVGSLIEVLD